VKVSFRRHKVRPRLLLIDTCETWRWHVLVASLDDNDGDEAEGRTLGSRRSKRTYGTSPRIDFRGRVDLQRLERLHANVDGESAQFCARSGISGMER